MEKILKYKKILLLWILLLAIMISSVGVAWGRYNKSMEETNVLFNISNVENVFIWQVSEDGFTPLIDDSFEVSETTTTLDFAVSNSESEDDFWAETLTFTPKIYISENIVASENLTIELKVESDGEEIIYTAIPEKIVENTDLYYNFGAGWAYSFYEENGELYEFELQGEQYSVFTANISINANEETLNYMMLFVIE